MCHIKADEELYFAIHFKSLTEEAYIEDLNISWLENNQFSILETSLVDHCLTVKGWVKHPDYPGIPVRTELLVNGDAVDEYLARSAPSHTDVERNIPSNAFLFNLSKNLPYSAKSPTIEILVENGKKRPL